MTRKLLSCAAMIAGVLGASQAFAITYSVDISCASCGVENGFTGQSASLMGTITTTDETTGTLSQSNISAVSLTAKVNGISFTQTFPPTSFLFVNSPTLSASLSALTFDFSSGGYLNFTAANSDILYCSDSSCSSLGESNSGISLSEEITNESGIGAFFAETGSVDIATATTAATPLPAALPLFASGLGGLALFGWRRKRKTQAIAD